MEMFVKKLMFLMIFAIIVFLVARTLELVAWYETGLFMMKLVDPLSLSVKKLKGLLDGRGLSYEGVVDKAELTHLVTSSVEGEVQMMEKEAHGDDEELTTQFSSKTRFDEEVEDKKDSMWLVQVIPRNHGPLLGRKAWSTVVKKLSRFGIHHGSFDCSVHTRICAQKNWNLPLLLLAMPQGHRHKDHVTLATFSSTGKAHQIIRWVNTQLAIKIKTERRKIGQAVLWDRVETGDALVQMVLVSTSNEPPMFFSALNLKYSGRVRFLFVHVQDDATVERSTDEIQKKYPQYYVVTPEGRRVYGNKSGEYYTYKALDIFLQTLTPEANDIFVLSFTIVNSISLIGLFVIQGGIAKRICTFLWTLGKYNITFLLLWLPMLGIIQLPCMSSILDYIYYIIRLISHTWLMSKLRQDWLMYSGNSSVVIGAFFLYCIFVNWISRKLHSASDEDSMTSATWIRTSLVDYYSFLIRPSPTFRSGPPHNGHLEEGLDMLIEHMAVPDLWLHTTIPTDYIKDLLTWRFTPDWMLNCSASKENDSIDSEKCHAISRDHKKSCPYLRQYVSCHRFDCTCVLGIDSIDEQCSRSEPLIHHNHNNNFFVVTAKDEKPVFHQPAQTLHTDAENTKCHFSNINLEKQHSLKMLPAQLEEKNPNHESVPDELRDTTCICQCAKKRFSYSDTHDRNPEITDYQKSFSPCTNGECNKNITISKKNSPKHHTKMTKPKSRPQTSYSQSDVWPESMLFNTQCSICLDAYTHGVGLCGLPCGHSYHRQCIVAWLTSGNHVCPICRWPAYKKKACKLSKHME